MTDEGTLDVKTLAVVLLATTLGLVLFVPTASAQQAACTNVLENWSESPGDSSTPGGILADAIGDQRDEIANERGDSRFQARLENATSTRERARVVADEVDRIEANVSTLERCWGINRTRRTADRSLSELNETERAALENYTRSLHARLNETQTAATRLPEAVREARGIDDERLGSLERRIVAVRNATAREEATSVTDSPSPFG